MIRKLYSLISILMLLAAAASCSSTPFDDLPRPIASFVTEYFPFGAIESYNVDEKTGESTVKIEDGAVLRFDADNRWTDVDGRGRPLPQQFLYDQLPKQLYDYIESMERLGQVYRVTRSPAIIMVDFHDSKVEYDQVTQTITYPDAPVTSQNAVMF